MTARWWEIPSTWGAIRQIGLEQFGGNSVIGYILIINASKIAVSNRKPVVVYENSPKNGSTCMILRSGLGNCCKEFVE